MTPAPPGPRVLAVAAEVASACGMTLDELYVELQKGRSMADVCAQHGLDAEELTEQAMRTSQHRWVRWAKT